MKKCLLFLFVFGITFSFWNIYAFAYSTDFPRIYVKYNDDPNDDTFYCYSNFDDNADLNIVYSGTGSTKYLTSNINLATCSDRYGNTHFSLNYWESYFDQQNSRYQSGGAYLASCNLPIIAVNANITPADSASYSDQVFDSLEDYYNPPDPDIDIYQCAYFFEPSGTGNDLYSMYCFPQELDDGEEVDIYYNNLNNIGFEITTASVDTLKRCYLNNGSTHNYYHSIEYWLEMIDQIELENDNVIDFLFTTPIYAMYCNFIENNGNTNYNIFPLTEESWWNDIVNLIGFDDTTLGFIWEWLFGNPDPDYHNVTINNSPSPSPLPTPIPYRTILVPDGNGGYEFQYEYEDKNGNPITASAPPEQPNYNSDALVTQAVNINISGIPVSDVEGVQSLLNVIGNADADYQEGFQVIGQSFAILPSKWFMFFGIPAAIILIAGIIKSLLG